MWYLVPTPTSIGCAPSGAVVPRLNAARDAYGWVGSTERSSESPALLVSTVILQKSAVKRTFSQLVQLHRYLRNEVQAG